MTDTPYARLSPRGSGADETFFVICPVCECVRPDSGNPISEFRSKRRAEEYAEFHNTSVHRFSECLWENVRVGQVIAIRRFDNQITGYVRHIYDARHDEMPYVTMETEWGSASSVAEPVAVYHHEKWKVMIIEEAP